MNPQAAPSTIPIIAVQRLTKQYGSGPPILREVSLSFKSGEFAAILGLSGAGKSTFLRCLNRLVDPTSGQIWVPAQLLDVAPSRGESPPLADSLRVDGAAPERLVDIARASPKDLRKWRRKVGMIFQQFNLAKRLSVVENVLSGSLGYANGLPSIFRFFSEEQRDGALRSLDRVGLVPFAYQRADAISGGQQQRVAIARALMQHPAVILADEPVASLDPKLSIAILDLLKKVCAEDGITVVVSLHVLELAKKFSTRLIGLAGGEVVFDGSPSELGDLAVKRIYQARTEELQAYSPSY